ncbi:MAG TPA: ATP-binding SpoIIE family protein phosphatase [Spirochaetia bacterium]|nr:ATP-binding SpoIIE family protein phosphatase [Spirochaetia bacterium]
MAPEESPKHLRLTIASDEDILSARSQVRATALQIGFQTTDMVRIVTAVSELARNILLYAGRGELSVGAINENGREGLVITARDQGPGIPDINKALMDGFSTSGGLGLGLPGARRLMDEFEILSEVRKGTMVKVKKWLGEGPMLAQKQKRDRSPVTSATAARALPGEETTGDRSVVRIHPGGVLFAVIDGLGHGPEAARAAGIAAEVFDTSPSTDIVSLVQECHERLQRSRGVVMTVVSINTATNRASWISVGNVQGMLEHVTSRQNGSGRAFTLLRSGIVGQKLPTLQPLAFTVEAGDIFVVATDGVSRDFMRERSLDQAPQLLADRILERYGLDNDDALVLVVRYTGDA